jgi:pimeloyl-ACP methyl ester carboxylesterase
MRHVVQGSGRCVLSLHGALGTAETALPLMAQVEGMVVAPDLRGFGGSPDSDESHYSWERYVDDVFDLLDELGVESAVWGGTSLGVGIALMAAALRPERVDALVLAGFSLGARPATVDAQRPVIRGVLDLIEKASREGGHVLVALGGGDAVRETMFLDLWQLHEPASLGAFARGMREQMHPITEDLVRAITVPVLVIPGDDPVHAPACSDDLLALLETATSATQAEGPAAAAAFVRSLPR